MPDLICHLAWMVEYKGEDNVVAGGFDYVAETGHAHECRNFETDADTKLVYGYVQAKSGTINIDRLGAAKGAESVGGVRVIFTATEPSSGQRLVVGYYIDATVYRCRRPGLRSLPLRERELIEHSIEVAEDNAFLIPVGNRTLGVPHHGKGLPGQSITFYPNDSDSRELKRFLSAFDRFVATTPTHRARPAASKAGGGGGWPKSPDIERNARVEQAALDRLRDHLGKEESYGRFWVTGPDQAAR